jgi:hypothetical protein
MVPSGEFLSFIFSNLGVRFSLKKEDSSELVFSIMLSISGLCLQSFLI